MHKPVKALSEMDDTKTLNRQPNNKVLIVDEHPLIRLALHTCLSQQGLEVVAEASNGREAIRYIHQFDPDLIITELDIPAVGGLVILEHIKLLKLPIKTLVFSAHTSRLSIYNCALAGAHGYVGKKEELSTFLNALQCVQAGAGFYPDWVHKVESANSDPMSCLSGRERQVLQLLSEGLSNIQIAERMQLSDKTVSTFKTRSLRKLNVRSIVEIMHQFKQPAE